jgi:hypothetical protein
MSTRAARGSTYGTNATDSQFTSWQQLKRLSETVHPSYAPTHDGKRVDPGEAHGEQRNRALDT